MDCCVVRVAKLNEQCYVDVATFIVLNVYKIARSRLSLCLIESPLDDDCAILVNLEAFQFADEVLDDDHNLVDMSRWPLILMKNHVVSGLASVTRQLCKLSDEEDVRKLLGFRDACLQACAESSPWTRFCEIDLLATVDEVFRNECFNEIEQTLDVPRNIIKFEVHLRQPVKMHNVYKLAREQALDPSISSSIPKEQLEVNHHYAEGAFVTLADVIIYLCVDLIMEFYRALQGRFELPLIDAWRTRVRQRFEFIPFSLRDERHFVVYGPHVRIVHTFPDHENGQRFNLQERPHVNNATKQYKLETAFRLMCEFKCLFRNDGNPFGHQRSFDWAMVPAAANPANGSLPVKRAKRKCEQLETMVKATLEVVGDRTDLTIVDFCSGSSYLGILVACLLPNCRIVLVENKETSLARARRTVETLALTNVVTVQSNLEYFDHAFEVGLALHACGVATDMMLEMCMMRGASFVCCPCCYGAIKNCHRLDYPRSSRIRNLFVDRPPQLYFNVAHAADQTHDEKNAKTKQGFLCMDIIDTDRKECARERGFNVWLGKLSPVNCTTKNNLLVGIYPRETVS